MSILDEYEPDPDDAADDALATERATTVEDVMDSLADEEGYANESSYTPADGLLDELDAGDDEGE